MNDATGVIHIHSCPIVLAPNVEWTLQHVFGLDLRLAWSPQPHESGTVSASIAWEGPLGSASRSASALRGWEQTRFEIWEAVGPGRDGVRYAHTPDLGIFFTLTDAAGNSMVGEDRIRYAMDVAAGNVNELERELALALGTAWDDELEPYRQAALPTVIPARREVGSR